MRRLTQLSVLKSAALAAGFSAVLCYPRLSAWRQDAHPMWYLEAMIFLGGILLWGFVFAWHEHYTQRPVFRVPREPRLWLLASVAGVGIGVFLALFLDPSLRGVSPQDYPRSLRHWAGMTLFHLGFTQLFLVFAPFAWSVRLFRKVESAIVFTTAFGVVLLWLKTQTSAVPFPPVLLACLFLLRAVLGLLGILLYLRGGVWLVWWWAFLIETRHLAPWGEGL